MAAMSKCRYGYFCSKSLTKMLLKTYDLAVSTKQASAAAQAVMGMGELHGLIVDRAQLEAVIRKPSESPDAPDTMSEDEWAETYGEPDPPPHRHCDVELILHPVSHLRALLRSRAPRDCTAL